MKKIMNGTKRSLLTIITVVIIFVSLFPVFSVAAMPVAVQDIYWSAIVTEANKHIGKAYVSCSRGPDTFDCSGLSYYVYKQTGHPITSCCAACQAEEMFNSGKSVTSLNKSYLIFYDYNKTTNDRYKDIDHVSIYVGGGYMIDASSSNKKVVKRSSTIMASDIVMKARPETYL